MPLDEPLYDVVHELSVKPRPTIPESKPLQVDDSILGDCINDWNAASKKMVVVGVNQPNKIEQKWLEALAADDSVVVFTETTSNLHHDTFFSGIDKLIAPLKNEDFVKLQPDILLTFGGLIVSKKIKAFLREYGPQQHWHIDLKKANDTFFSLNNFIETTPNYFFSKFLPQNKIN